ncbi:SulP family inorganic anion transporter [Paenibacillus aurantius]|uniref:SulP family inorganic anion transporter n=1 Tax=Paenibacillus aurantius TaxID=2918900 RepID=A0AA96LCT9_9BACL|nr:SulP family inorganic anion transporter [Paenibacillus aurantius]WNQ11301.1 SulP family inorganic anion transporter [Paenibacillus aurantius]
MKGTGRFQRVHVQTLRHDLTAGLVVGVVAIPLAMAFAIASGVKPQYGIYSTIIAGFLISLLGGSRFQIGGPTGAFIPVLLGIVIQFGYEKLLIAGMLAGLILVLMGVFKLGVLIQYIPRPVTIGFTSGIAVIIFSGQISNFLGLRGLQSHESFWDNMKEIGMHLYAVNLYSILTALLSLAVILILPRFLPKIPASLIGLLVSSLMASLFFGGKVATIGSTFGAIPSSLPSLTLPTITIDNILELLPAALVIAMLGGIESLLSAVVADGMTGTRHNSNRELIGQGIANLITPLFGGIPATGAIARTATNIKNGAVSPVSGMVHGLVVLLVLLLLAPWASLIPLASMAPILMVVAWNMSERRDFAHVLKTRTSDSLVLVITFLLTVFTNLTTAVEAGLGLAVILFVKRMSDNLVVTKVLPDSHGHDCPQIHIYTIEGPLFFGTAHRFEKSIMDTIPLHPRILLLRMGKMPFMDSTGESNLASIVNHFNKSGGTVLISDIQPQPREYLKKTGLSERIGESQFFEHTGEAISAALERLDQPKCRACKHLAYRECTALSSCSPKPLDTKPVPSLPANH